MSPHRCVCCAPLSCQQPGPCCEPPPEGNVGYGRCTPRGYVKTEGGAWEGSAPTSIHGKVSAAGRFFYAKKVKNFAHPVGIVGRWTLPFAFSNADPRAGVILTGGSASVPCADFSGGMEFVDPYDPADPLDTLTDVTCAYPLAPVVQIVRRLGATLRYTPRGDLETGDFSWGSGGSDGALGIYVVEVSVWEVLVRLTIGVGRPAGRPPGFPAVAFAKAAMILGPGFDSIASVPGIDITALADAPCGTKVTVNIVKPMIQPPLDDTEPAWCATGGIIDPDQCFTCRAVGVEMTVTLDLADLFTACAKCEAGPQPCACHTSHVPRFNGLGQWQPPTLSVHWSRRRDYTLDSESGPNPNYPVWWEEGFGGDIPLVQCPGAVGLVCQPRFAGEVIGRYNRGANRFTQFESPLAAEPGFITAGPLNGVLAWLSGNAFLFGGVVRAGAIDFERGLLGSVDAAPGQSGCVFFFSEGTLPLEPGMSVSGSGASRTFEWTTTQSGIPWGWATGDPPGVPGYSGSASGTYTETFSYRLTVAGLVDCIEEPPGGGGGGGEEESFVVGGGSGGSGCSGCGGGIA